jgi:lysine 2,3-aminomutase
MAMSLAPKQGAPRRSTKTARMVADLVALGALAPDQAAGAEAAARAFPVAITPEVLATIDPRDPDDPIAKQYLPSARELTFAPEERADPIGDKAHAPIKGLVHRHPDRVLLKPTLACAVHCRFCFRREALAEPETLTDGELEAALAYVRARPTIKEVILTGGDPFVLSPERLGRLVAALAAIPHLAILRVHSRVPIAAPSLVTPDLVDALKTDKAMYAVVHINHARELTDAAKAACRAILAAGIPVLSQSVLLRGVNDTVDALVELMESLVAQRIKPYYLHHCDLVRGAGHFRTMVAEGRALMAALRRRVSGLAMPTYVLDVPGGFGKVPVGPDYGPDDAGLLRDAHGRTHDYPLD